MRIIYKYKVVFGSYSELDLPKDAQILKIDEQKDEIVLWALVNPDKPIITRKFKIEGTGYPIEEKENLEYINTFYTNNNELVWHVFEILKQ